ncbi:hypothetical protein AGDE_15984 [Angomonas deanei]|uniref:Uncharacterized protein n=1 Tax=Angomonas deanei TaxID=59799 RepID=A0A7G2CNS3_9TRYP|nr:hypothetical protein AGDE_15984 [Angomonas deanei]CAD2220601.1 hypothetical protein, conserved [Angomonas deanei]|eukprot:EPY17986.1 hypothetical protein AGDE_15984 [Angomonas deanei]
MGQITKRYGAEAQKAYDQSIAERALGDVVVTEVGPASREGRIFIASLVAQEPAPSGQIPLMNNSALQKCLGHCVDFCRRQSASLHLVKPASGTEVNWAEVEVFLKEKSASKKVHVLVYGADPHSTSHPNPEVKRPRADSAGEGKEIESVTEKKPKREVSAEDKSNRNGDFLQ